MPSLRHIAQEYELMDKQEETEIKRRQGRSLEEYSSWRRPIVVGASLESKSEKLL